MSSTGQDIIRWVIDRMMAHEDSITQELALTVEREARREWGGQRIEYVAKTCAADAQAEATALRADAQAAAGRQAVGEVAKRHGVHRSTVYRLLRRGQAETE